VTLVFVSHMFTNCEVFPELPSIQGWFEAMTSLGRLIFFDQPGTGVSDPASPNLERWAASITAVLDDLGSGREVRRAAGGATSTTSLNRDGVRPSEAATVVIGGRSSGSRGNTEGLCIDVTDRDSFSRDVTTRYQQLAVGGLLSLPG